MVAFMMILIMTVMGERLNQPRGTTFGEWCRVEGSGWRNRFIPVRPSDHLRRGDTIANA